MVSSADALNMAVLISVSALKWGNILSRIFLLKTFFQTVVVFQVDNIIGVHWKRPNDSFAAEI